MTVQKAVLMQGPGEAGHVTDAPVPKLRDDYTIVRVKAIALNPTDWKAVAYRPSKGALIGCDYAGIVEEVGENVTSVKKGDRVAGLVHGANEQNHEDGAFAQYIIAKAAVQTKIPDSLTFEAASTLGVGITTVGQALYQSLGLALPNDPIKDHTPLLIYGGSTATGTLAIQFAKLSGYKVITTASPRNHELLRSLGADKVLDYNKPDVGSYIRALTDDNLKYVLDCIGEGNAPQICSDAISSTGGTFSTIALASQVQRPDVVNRATLAYTAFGEDFAKGDRKWEASQEDLEFATKFWQLTGQLLAEGKIKPHPQHVVDGGLATVIDSLKNLREGKASGIKFVHLVE